MSDNGLDGNGDWIHSALDRYEGELTRYAQRITGDADTARDVVQETFLRLCRQSPEDLDGHLTEWLYTVCRNRAVDVKRKESRMTTLAEMQVSNLSDNRNAEKITEQQDTTHRILQLVDQLPEKQGEVIRLKFQNGLSYRRIGEVTGQSVSNVSYLMHRGLKTIRKQLKETS